MSEQPKYDEHDYEYIYPPVGQEHDLTPAGVANLRWPPTLSERLAQLEEIVLLLTTRVAQLERLAIARKEGEP